MSVYVSDCGDPNLYLWGDEEIETIAMLYACGASLEQDNGSKNWPHYWLTAAQFNAAVTLGARPTDRFGAAEWLALKRGDRDMLSKLRRLRPMQVSPT